MTIDRTVRFSSIDFFRATAIVAVVLFHISNLPYGYLGVDLFFVISGFLASRPLIKNLENGQPVDWLRFVVSRGFKIWPSYYAFFVLANAAAYGLYRNSHPDQFVPLNEWAKYIFFYRNYRGTFHWSFDHVWSLCIEEHFYLLLPLLFIAADKASRPFRALVGLIGLMIAAGIAFKFVSHAFGIETYSATHNRIDALGWGVLLSVLTSRYGLRVIRAPARGALILCALGVAAASVLLHASGRSPLFNMLAFHSVLFSFCALILGCLDLDFSRLPFVRGGAEVSYNWYLWHTLLVYFVQDHVPNQTARATVYFFLTLGLAKVFTRLIEQPALRARGPCLERWFGPEGKARPAESGPLLVKTNPG